MASIHEEIEQRRKNDMPKPDMLIKFRQYARGRQRSTLNAAQGRILRGLLGNIFCDNVCNLVLGQQADRLLLARYEVASVEVEKFLRELWTLNHMAELAHQVHYSMFRDGVIAVGLGWNGERVVLTRELWWNGRKGLFVALDGEGKAEYAVKEWQEKGKKHRTIYYPDRIERYRKEDGWRPYRLPDDPQEGPIVWVDVQGNPLGVPFVVFANVVEPNDIDEGEKADEADPRFGVSELDGGLLGLQDEINDLHRDISANARFAGYQMIFATGTAVPSDEDGMQIPLRVEPGAIFHDKNPDAKFGVLPPGPIDSLYKTLQTKLEAVSRKSRVPMHQLGGVWPSGAALFRVERPLIKKTEATARSVGPAWASLAHMATTLANAFGGAGLNTEVLIGAVFMPSEGDDPEIIKAIVDARKDHVSNREILRIQGYSPEQIEQIEKELAEERNQLGVIDSINAQRAQLALDREKQPTTNDITNRLANAGGGQ